MKKERKKERMSRGIFGTCWIIPVSQGYKYQPEGKRDWKLENACIETSQLPFKVVTKRISY